ncbi:MAG: tetratricopeptide repeat protein [Treponema sp.]|nr:tetratricopeptide repeat protein [Treponema sp.]
MQSGNEKQPPIGERITEFVQKNRKTIFVSAVVAVLLLVGSVVTLIVMDVLRGRAIAAVEELGVRYEALRDFASMDPGPEYDLADDGMDAELADLLADLRAFASRNSGYAGGRAWSMVGSIYGRKGAWAEAEAAWLAAARATSRSYMAPIALFNAAAAAEEQGGAEDLERAISHYTDSIAATAGFFAAPRAQFSIGRLHEALGNVDAAIQAYRDLIFGWPHDTAWSNLAQSRIIALETMGWRLDAPVVRPPVEDVDAWPDIQWENNVWDDNVTIMDFAEEDFMVWPPVLDFAAEPETELVPEPVVLEEAVTENENGE